ncbi:MAG: GH3 auxin-responsive promoter family protein [Minisyncoccia bacterium]
MNFIHTLLKLPIKYRLAEIERIEKDPKKAQEKVLFSLLRRSKNTEWGKKHKYSSIKTVERFQKNVPINLYEDLQPFISRMMTGEKNVLWPGLTTWFSKSSGTTNARSKFIPVSKESIKDCHTKAGTNEVCLYIKNNPNTKIFKGKSLCVGGSFTKIKQNPDIFCGDISAVMMKNMPPLGKYLRTPSLKTALLEDYEEKIEKLANEAINQNVTSIAGVPTWTAILVKKVLEKTKAKNIFEVWPNLEVFFHGAVSFLPYKKSFQELFPSPQMNYMEAYNSSEGFFAVQDDPLREGEMLLMPDCGVFYEFIPTSEFELENPKVYTMSDVEIDKNYVLVISTNSGLWRYIIGDTVSFTTLLPHRIKITGRTKHFINVFGEEVMVHNTDLAIKKTCDQTGTTISEYTVAPIFMNNSNRGGHEWVIEFENPPSSLKEFSELLDSNLRAINSDYDAKRYKDIALAPLIINSVSKDTFYNWMKKRGKLGGQNKVPRLSNNRTYLEEIKKIAGL